MPRLSVIICTYNPRTDFLQRTLAALERQDLPREEWELILVDNASSPPVAEKYDLSWHPQGRIVVEEKLGLAHARLRGFEEVQSELIVWSDDDTLLEPNYLSESLRLAAEDPELGAWGGKSLPEYEEEPPPWFGRIAVPLGCRDLGDAVLTAGGPGVSVDGYPECSPIGAGLVIRREAFRQYVIAAREDPRRMALGRTGKSLVSGEDNDIVLTLLKEGWRIGYFPSLSLTHLIPSRRLEKAYLARLAHASNLSWVQVLALHGICPWKPIHPATRFLRAARSYLVTQAWRGPDAYITWQGRVGVFDGLAQLDSFPRAS